MRAFINGDGNDSTLAVRAFLAQNRQLQIADLYVISTAPNYASFALGQQFLLTDYPAPLLWEYNGTFLPSVISRGEVESKIGLQAQTLEITWSPGALAFGAAPLSVLQGLQNRIFAGGSLEVWTALMPTPGDCDTYGACCMFAGRIGAVDVDRLSARITVTARLAALNVQVGTQIVEPGNIMAQYSPGILPAGAPSSLTVQAGSTPRKLYAAATGFTPVADLYDQGYLVFTSGMLGGHYAGVYRQDVESGLWAFYFGRRLPFAPQPGDTLAGYIPVPADYAGAGAQFQGWPYVPNPIDSALLIG